MGFNRRILSTFFVSYVESLFSCESIPLSNTYVKDRQEGFLETEISDDRNRETQSYFETIRSFHLLVVQGMSLLGTCSLFTATG